MGQTTKLRGKKLTLGFKSQTSVPAPKVSAPPVSNVAEPVAKNVNRESVSDSAADHDRKPAKKTFRDYRTMRGDLKDRILTNMVNALALDETGQLPVFFRQDRIMPAKIGLFHDLIQRFPNFNDRKALKAALVPFFRDLAYIRSIIEEEQRFDLDLNPVEGELGEITQSHKEDARKELDFKLKNIKKRMQKKNSAVPD